MTYKFTFSEKRRTPDKQGIERFQVLVQSPRKHAIFTVTLHDGFATSALIENTSEVSLTWTNAAFDAIMSHYNTD